MRTALLLCALAVSLSAAQNPATIAHELVARQNRELADAAVAWLKTVDLTPLEAANLGADPRESERLAAVEAKQVNEVLSLLRSLKKQVEAGDADAVTNLREWFRGLDPKSPVIARLVASRAH